MVSRRVKGWLLIAGVAVVGAVAARWPSAGCFPCGGAGRLDLAAEQFEIVRREWTKRYGPDSDQVYRIDGLIAGLAVTPGSSCHRGLLVAG
jgi:hypothetical protein